MKGESFNVPQHVPSELVVDFDAFNIEDAGDDIWAAWLRIQRSLPDIFWTPRNGGHWVAMRATEIEDMQSNWQQFSNENFLLPEVKRPFTLMPLGVDPPIHSEIRALIRPAFTPKEVQKLTSIARDTAIDAIESFKDRGYCEFVSEFAQILPITVFLGMMGLPKEDLPKLIPYGDALVRASDPEKQLWAAQGVAAYLTDWAEARAKKPEDDIISRVVHAKIGGRPISKEEILGTLSLLVFGGLDTVAMQLTFIALHLAKNPSHRHQLIDSPEIRSSAIEELMRRYTVVNTSRKVAYDFEYKGISFKKGDAVMLPRVGYSLDERRVENPLEVDFHRPAAVFSHVNFGGGIHSCIGAVLARNEINVFLEEWLKRIPDFRLKTGYTPHQFGGNTNSMHELQLEWDVAK